MPKGRKPRETTAIRTPEAMGDALKAMFESVAHAPLPQDMLELVDELEASQERVRRPRERRVLP